MIMEESHQVKFAHKIDLRRESSSSYSYSLVSSSSLATIETRRYAGFRLQRNRSTSRFTARTPSPMRFFAIIDVAIYKLLRVSYLLRYTCSCQVDCIDIQFYSSRLRYVKLNDFRTCENILEIYSRYKQTSDQISKPLIFN